MLKAFRLIIFIAVVTSVSSCSQAPSTGNFIPFISHTDKNQIRSVLVCSSVNANQGNAIQLDMLFLQDSDVLAALPLTSPEWFANRAQLLSTYVDSLQPVMLELPPLYQQQLVLPKDSRKAVNVIAYAHYASAKGQARQALPDNESVVIYMDQHDWRFSEQCAGH